MPLSTRKVVGLLVVALLAVLAGWVALADEKPKRGGPIAPISEPVQAQAYISPQPATAWVAPGQRIGPIAADASVEAIIQRLEQIQKEEAALKEALTKKLKDQKERLQKLGIGEPQAAPVPPPAPSNK